MSDTGERLAELETHVESLIGNGQPGRLTKLEANVNELIRWKSKTVGWGIGVSSVVSTVVAFVYQIFKWELNETNSNRAVSFILILFSL